MWLKKFLKKIMNSKYGSKRRTKTFNMTESNPLFFYKHRKKEEI